MFINHNHNHNHNLTLSVSCLVSGCTMSHHASIPMGDEQPLVAGGGDKGFTKRWTSSVGTNQRIIKTFSFMIYNSHHPVPIIITQYVFDFTISSLLFSLSLSLSLSLSVSFMSDTSTAVSSSPPPSPRKKPVLRVDTQRRTNVTTNTPETPSVLSAMDKDDDNHKTGSKTTMVKSQPPSPVAPHSPRHRNPQPSQGGKEEEAGGEEEWMHHYAFHIDGVPVCKFCGSKRDEGMPGCHVPGRVNSFRNPFTKKGSKDQTPSAVAAAAAAAVTITTTTGATSPSSSSSSTSLEIPVHHYHQTGLCNGVGACFSLL